MKRFHIGIVLLLLTLFTGAGWYFGQKYPSAKMTGVDSKPSESSNGVVQDDSGKKVKYWYDPMVPGQKFDKPGKSPFMDMMLEPKYANEGSGGEDNGVAISAQTRQNLGIRLQKAQMVSFGQTLQAVGRVEPDERRYFAVQTRMPGYVEKLHVRALGDPVKNGQKIAEIYAPEILAAQQEYITLLSFAQGSLKSVDENGALRMAARNRLQLLGMSEGEIKAIAKNGKANPRFGVYAPASGVVSELGIREGAQLMSGASLMQITDLKQVWFVAEIPERDADQLTVGLDAEVNLQGIANRVIKGKISYLYPTLNGASRTLQVRVELPNQTDHLRPGMYGTVVFTGQSYQALSVASESIIATGTRKVVIVKQQNSYRPVEVVTGKERENHTEILSGLSEGEEVVASGQFLIDSEASLSGVLARLSNQDEAMNPEMEMPTSESNEASTKDLSVEKMPKGRGKVVEVDAKTGRVVLEHEPIEALGWPSMTMGFKVKENKLLNTLKTGDSVDFDLKADAPESPDKPAQYRIEHMEKVESVKGGMKDSNGAKP